MKFTSSEEGMPVETITLAGTLKWLVGLILVPWLWHERKRTDKLEEAMSAKHYTKDETKEQILLRLKPIEDKLDMIYDELKRLNN